MLQGEVEVHIGVSSCSADRLVRSVAATIFLESQGQPATIEIDLEPDKPGWTSYCPLHDLNLLHGGLEASHIAQTFKFDQFEEQFVRVFCEALLFPAENETRDELEKNCSSLLCLGQAAYQERVITEDLRLPGPFECEFQSFSADLIELVTSLIEKRILIPTNERYFYQLFKSLFSSKGHACG